jgi:hypothetical protein
MLILNTDLKEYLRLSHHHNQGGSKHQKEQIQNIVPNIFKKIGIRIEPIKQIPIYQNINMQHKASLF